MKKIKKKDNNLNILSAVKAKQRQDEITEFGKLINHSNIVKNKKKYTRKNKHKNRDDQFRDHPDFLM